MTPEKLENCEKEDIIGSYFTPTTKRAAELLRQSSKLDANRVFNRWKDFAKRNKPKANEDFEGNRPSLSGSFNNLWMNGSPDHFRKPLRLEALPNIDQRRHRSNQRLNSLDFL